ncbi:hypothetical protein GCM10010273_13750 [Streptomyces lavendulocolor]
MRAALSRSSSPARARAVDPWSTVCTVKLIEVLIGTALPGEAEDDGTRGQGQLTIRRSRGNRSAGPFPRAEGPGP